MADDDVISDWPGGSPGSSKSSRRKAPKKSRAGMYALNVIVVLALLLGGLAAFAFLTGRSLSNPFGPPVASSPVDLSAPLTASTPAPIGSPVAAPSPDTAPPPAALQAPAAVVAPAPAEHPSPTTAVQIVKDYTSSQDRADAAMKEHLLEITGTIDTINKGMLGTTYVTLSGGPQVPKKVQCAIDNADDVANLQPGMTAVIIGRCSGDTGNVTISDCHIVPHK